MRSPSPTELTFMLLIHLWLRSFGITHQLFFQTDWGEEFGGNSLTKLARLQTYTFDPLKVQLLRIRKRQWKDNAYVERTHRTDDEEFYELYDGELEVVHLNQALQEWEWTYNHLRPHQALDWKTAMEYISECHPELASTAHLSHMY